MEDQATLLRRVSRTFALSIERLPAGVLEPVRLAYLLLRVSDILEDHPDLPSERKVELLRLWADVLGGARRPEELESEVAPLDGSDPEIYMAQRCSFLMHALATLPPELQQAVVQRVRKTTLGMARWQLHPPCVADEAELDDYMHEVAGRVGYLVTDIFAFRYAAVRERREALMPLARQFGLALQTVNVIRGMRTDYERGWVFVPKTYYEPLGLTADQLFDGRNVDAAAHVVALLADKAAVHLAHGMAYIRWLPRRYHQIRLACIWPLFFAARTLAISRNNPSVLRGEAKIDRSQVARIVQDTTFFGWSNRWLERYYESLSRSPAPELTPA